LTNTLPSRAYTKKTHSPLEASNNRIMFNLKKEVLISLNSNSKIDMSIEITSF